MKKSKAKLEQMKTISDAKLHEECSFSPKQSKVISGKKEKEASAMVEKEEMDATKKAMHVEMPVLNLHKKGKALDHRAETSLSKRENFTSNAESYVKSARSNK